MVWLTWSPTWARHAAQRKGPMPCCSSCCLQLGYNVQQYCSYSIIYSMALVGQLLKGVLPESQCQCQCQPALPAQPPAADAGGSCWSAHGNPKRASKSKGRVEDQCRSPGVEAHSVFHMSRYVGARTYPKELIKAQSVDIGCWHCCL